MQKRLTRKHFGIATLIGTAVLFFGSITACSDDDFGQERPVSDMAMTLPDVLLVPADLVTPVPAPTCSDGIKNGMETDVDCGGMNCPKCAVAKKCVATTDCLNGVCKNNVCLPPFGCDLLRSCEMLCGTVACRADCATKVTTPNGSQLLDQFINCIVGDCPNTASAICDPAGPNYNDTNCKTCQQNARAVTCANQNMNCFNDG